MYYPLLLRNPMESVYRKRDIRLLNNDWTVTKNRPQFELTKDDYMPALYYFSDLNDPATAKLIFPDEFEHFFGDGYTLKQVLIQLTDEPVTKGKIDKELPWINNSSFCSVGGKDSNKQIIPSERVIKHMRNESYRNLCFVLRRLPQLSY